MLDLRLADCREVLPNISPDIILTDPVWPNVPKGLLAGSEDPHRLFQETMDLVPVSVQRIVVVMRCDSDPRFLCAIPQRFKFFRSIQLTYVLPSYLGRVLGGDETAYWFGSPIKFQAGRRLVPGRGPIAQPRDRLPNGHPCSRAQIHFDWLVDWAADKGEVVCDPFMGSGTTGVACAKIGLSFIGIEIDPDYHQLAVSRIAEAELFA